MGTTEWRSNAWTPAKMHASVMNMVIHCCINRPTARSNRATACICERFHPSVKSFRLAGWKCNPLLQFDKNQWVYLASVLVTPGRYSRKATVWWPIQQTQVWIRFEPSNSTRILWLVTVLFVLFLTSPFSRRFNLDLTPASPLVTAEMKCW